MVFTSVLQCRHQVREAVAALVSLNNLEKSSTFSEGKLSICKVVFLHNTKIYSDRRNNKKANTKEVGCGSRSQLKVKPNKWVKLSELFIFLKVNTITSEGEKK